METITVLIGSITSMSGGGTQNLTREVQFEGEKLGQFLVYGYDKNGKLTDTRGVKQTLYKAADGRLIVHVDDWSHWQGEPTTYRLQEVTKVDLGPKGMFELLGLEVGMSRPYTLDDALPKE